jgi:hypothetical protein
MLQIKKSDTGILAGAFNFLGFKNNSSVTPLIKVPFMMSGGKPVPATTKEALDGYMLGVGQLDNYFANNPLPANMDPSKLRVFIHSSSQKFAQFYKALGSKHSEKYIRERVVGFNSVDRDSLVGQSAIPDFKDVTSTIGLNPELQAGPIGAKATFEGGNSYAETITHEFGHSLHRAISFMFGMSGLAGEADFNKAYRAIKRQFVSEYGKDSFAEHFAEAFSKYVTTGEATPEFKQFLQKYIHNVSA